MKFSIPVSHIRRVVSLVSDVVPARGISQEASGLLMECSKRAVFNAVGHDTIMRVSSEAEVEESGKACVNASVLASLVTTFDPLDVKAKTGTEKINVALDFRSGSLDIKAKTYYKGGKTVNNRRKVPLLNAEMFPTFPRYDQSDSFLFPGIPFKDAINKTHFAASSDAMAGIMSGVNISCKNGLFCVVATDGICLAEYTRSVDVDLEFDVTVPYKFAHKAARALDVHEDSVRLLPTNNIFWASSPGVLIGGITMLGKYPDYKNFLAEPENVAVVDRKLLTSNIKNLDFAAVEDDKVDLKFRNGELFVATELAENDSIACEGFSGEFDVSFNIKHLKSAIQVLEGDSVTIGFSAKSAPVYLSTTDYFEQTGSTFREVIMPLNV